MTSTSPPPPPPLPLRLPLLLLTIAFFATTVTASAAATARRRVVVGIPTVPRHRLVGDEAHYLERTLEALRREIAANGDADADADELSVKVVVVNHRPGEHAAFMRASHRQDYNGWATFLVPTASHSQTPQTQQPPVNHHHRALDDRVVRQTLDVVATIRLSLLAHEDDLYLAMEDDFEACAGFLHDLSSALAEADELHPTWIALRISYGFNGVVMPARDALALAAYLETHATRRPPDHLLVEFFAGETRESADHKRGRPHLAFRTNLLHHIGEASTLRPRRDAAPSHACGVPLDDGVLFPVESFVPCDAANARLVCESGLLNATCLA